MNRSLPIYEEPKSSLRKDGSRDYVHPADVNGRFTRVRYLVFAALVSIYIALPWIKINGNPAVFLDIQRRKFFLFGATFNAQDVWLIFFLLTGAAFLAIFVTAVWGRVFCGYACPQTVFLEGIYRRVERWIEGSRAKRLALNAAPWTLAKIAKKAVKHAVFLLISLILAHVFISYFVSLPALLKMMRTSPADHPEAFAWTFSITAFLHFNFGWFREQACLIVCPYGRLQSVLTDTDSIVIGYDDKRGEPRGKVKDNAAGDCVDCNRCVVVCPTGIDIREGLQIDCIGCAACVDACDDIMDRLDRPRGLVRYDSQTGLDGDKTRWLRPRVVLYAVLGVVGLVVAISAATGRQAFEANLLRLRGAPFVVDGDMVRNQFEIHVVNKRSEATTFNLVGEPQEGMEFIIPTPEIRLEPLDGFDVPVFVTLPTSSLRPGLEVRIRVSIAGDSDNVKVVNGRFLGPGGAGAGAGAKKP